MPHYRTPTLKRSASEMSDTDSPFHDTPKPRKVQRGTPIKWITTNHPSVLDREISSDDEDDEEEEKDDEEEVDDYDVVLGEEGTSEEEEEEEEEEEKIVHVPKEIRQARRARHVESENDSDSDSDSDNDDDNELSDLKVPANASYASLDDFKDDIDGIGQPKLDYYKISTIIDDAWHFYTQCHSKKAFQQYSKTDLEWLLRQLEEQWLVHSPCNSEEASFQLITRMLGTNARRPIASKPWSDTVRTMEHLLYVHNYEQEQRLWRILSKIELVFQTAQQVYKVSNNEMPQSAGVTLTLHAMFGSPDIPSDISVAKVFAHIMKDDIKYSDDLDKIAMWNPDTKLWLLRKPRYLGQLLSPVLMPHIEKLEDVAHRKQLLKWINQSRNYPPMINNFLKDLLGQTTAPDFFDKLDHVHPTNTLIPLANGMVGDLQAKGAVRQRTREDMFTYEYSHKLHERGDSPLVDEQVQHMMMEGGARRLDKEGYIRQELGVGMTPHLGRKKIVQFTGCRNTGKSKFLKAVVQCINHQATTLKEGLICYNPRYQAKLDGDSHNSGIFTTKKMTMGVIEEISPESHYHDKKVRMHQGAPVLTGRAAYASKDETFTNTCTIYVLGNLVGAHAADTTLKELQITTVEMINAYELTVENDEKAARMCEPEFQAQLFSWLYWSAVDSYDPSIKVIELDCTSVAIKYQKDAFSRFITECITIGGGTEKYIKATEIEPAYHAYCRKLKLKDTVEGRFSKALDEPLGAAKRDNFGKGQHRYKMTVRYNCSWNVRGFLDTGLTWKEEVVLTDVKNNVVLDEKGKVVKVSPFADCQSVRDLLEDEEKRVMAEEAAELAAETCMARYEGVRSG